MSQDADLFVRNSLRDAVESLGFMPPFQMAGDDTPSYHLTAYPFDSNGKPPYLREVQSAMGDACIMLVNGIPAHALSQFRLDLYFVMERFQEILTWMEFRGIGSDSTRTLRKLFDSCFPDGMDSQPVPDKIKFDRLFWEWQRACNALAGLDAPSSEGELIDAHAPIETAVEDSRYHAWREQGMFPRELAEWLDVSTKLVGGIANDVGVKRAKQGETNFRYTPHAIARMSRSREAASTEGKVKHWKNERARWSELFEILNLPNFGSPIRAKRK